MDTCEICQREAYNTHSTAGDACCWRGAHAMPSPHWKLECYRLGFERLKAENASLLESLRAAEKEAAKHEDCIAEMRKDFDEALDGQLDRAEAAEGEVSVLNALLSPERKELAARAAAAEQRNTALEGALVRLLETQTWSFSDEQAAAIDHACDNVLGRRVAARAALHDEERRQGDRCPACGVRGLSRDRLGGACHALDCPDPTAWLRAAAQGEEK